MRSGVTLRWQIAPSVEPVFLRNRACCLRRRAQMSVFGPSIAGHE